MTLCNAGTQSQARHYLQRSPDVCFPRRVLTFPQKKAWESTPLCHPLAHDDRVKESRLLSHESPIDSHAVSIRLV